MHVHRLNFKLIMSSYFRIQLTVVIMSLLEFHIVQWSKCIKTHQKITTIIGGIIWTLVSLTQQQVLFTKSTFFLPDSVCKTRHRRLNFILFYCKIYYCLPESSRCRIWKNANSLSLSCFFLAVIIHGHGQHGSDLPVHHHFINWAALGACPV